MVMDLRKASNHILFEDSYMGGTVLQTERGHIVAVTDEEGGVYLPETLLKPLQTRFFRILVHEEKVILSPVKIRLEVVAEEVTTPETPNQEKSGQEE